MEKLKRILQLVEDWLSRRNKTPNLPAMALDFGGGLGIALILRVEQSACVAEGSPFPHEKAQALVTCWLKNRRRGCEGRSRRSPFWVTENGSSTSHQNLTERHLLGWDRWQLEWLEVALTGLLKGFWRLCSPLCLYPNQSQQAWGHNMNRFPQIVIIYPHQQHILVMLWTQSLGS